MKLFIFTAIVALAGMSTATASLRGGAPLPSEMKDLLNKLVAADEGVADQSTCTAVKFQTCQIDGTHFGCAPNTVCNFVGPNNVSNNPGATTKGKYCQQHLEEDELVEESEYLQVASEDCKVLEPENGGCVPTNVAGLSCKDGYTCEGYEETPGVQDPTLGTCVLDTNRAVDPPEPSQSHAVRCHNDFYSQDIPCHPDTVDQDCRSAENNPLVCEAVCRPKSGSPGDFVCVAPVLEEEVEELAADEPQQPVVDPEPSPAVRCHNEFYTQDIPCHPDTVDQDCRSAENNPLGCEAVCRPKSGSPGDFVCVAFEEELAEDLAVN